MSIIKLFTLFTFFGVLTANVNIIGPMSLVWNMKKIDNGSKCIRNPFSHQKSNWKFRGSPIWKVHRWICLLPEEQGWL